MTYVGSIIIVIMVMDKIVRKKKFLRRHIMGQHFSDSFLFVFVLVVRLLFIEFR